MACPSDYVMTSCIASTTGQGVEAAAAYNPEVVGFESLEYTINENTQCVGISYPDDSSSIYVDIACCPKVEENKQLQCKTKLGFMDTESIVTCDIGENIYGCSGMGIKIEVTITEGGNGESSSYGYLTQYYIDDETKSCIARFTGGGGVAQAICCQQVEQQEIFYFDFNFNKVDDRKFIFFVLMNVVISCGMICVAVWIYHRLCRPNYNGQNGIKLKNYDTDEEQGKPLKQ